MSDAVGAAFLPTRIGAIVTSAFGALGALLAMMGIYGLVAFSVSQRQREIGVRIALGATGARVMWLVLHEAGRMVLVGAIGGLVLAGVLARTLSAFLYDVDPLDPLNFAAVLAVLLLTAAVAAAAPAWRASRVSPVVAFRQDG